jgi:fructoselysine-6-P-deglycase FrlB-like protein
MAGSVCLSVSQSGRSPDIVDLTRAARAGGAYTLAVTNDAASPLAAAADATLDIHAGPELSVAATKTFVTSALACLWLLAELVGDADLLSGDPRGFRTVWPRRSRWTGARLRGPSARGRSTRWGGGRPGRSRTRRR